MYHTEKEGEWGKPQKHNPEKQQVTEYVDTSCSLATLETVTTRGGRSVAATVPMGVRILGLHP